MDLNAISEKDWKEFEEEYPNAYMYLLRSSLKREKEELERIRKEGRLAVMGYARLFELINIIEV